MGGNSISDVAAGGRGNMWRSLVRSLASGLRSWRRRQREWVLLRELQSLDDHLLKDIGYRRDELLAKVRTDLDPESADDDAAKKAHRRTTCRCRLCGAPLRGCVAQV